MKKRIAILGSTGSIGKSTLEVIRKDKKNFDIILLTANNNYKKLIQQAKELNVKNILIKNQIFLLRNLNLFIKYLVYNLQDSWKSNMNNIKLYFKDSIYLL